MLSRGNATASFGIVRLGLKSGRALETLHRWRDEAGDSTHGTVRNDDGDTENNNEKQCNEEKQYNDSSLRLELMQPLRRCKFPPHAPAQII